MTEIWEWINKLDWLMLPTRKMHDENARIETGEKSRRLLSVTSIQFVSLAKKLLTESQLESICFPFVY